MGGSEIDALVLELLALPTIDQTFSEPPQSFWTAFGIAYGGALFVLLSMSLFIRQHWILELPDNEFRRWPVTLILLTFPFMAVFHLLSIVCIRSDGLFGILISLFECVALYQFSVLIVAQMDGDTACVQALAALKPDHYLARAPMCCARGQLKFDSRLYRAARFMVLQLCFIRPSIIILKAFLVVDGAVDRNHPAFNWIDFGCTLVCIWGLGVLLNGLKDFTPSAFNISNKFAAIQATVIITALLQVIIGHLNDGEVFNAVGIFDSETLGKCHYHWWCIVLLAFAGLYSGYAFSTRDYKLPVGPETRVAEAVGLKAAEPAAPAVAASI